MPASPLIVQLGRRYGTGPASLADIAAEEDLPRPYLEQLAMALRDAGLVVSTRGARGGYRAGRCAGIHPHGRRAACPVEPIAPMICASEEEVHGPGCERTSRCTVNLLWLRIRDAIVDSLESITLADLVPQRAIAIETLGARTRETVHA